MLDIPTQIMEQLHQLTNPAEVDFGGFSVVEARDQTTDRAYLEAQAEKMVHSVTDGFSLRALLRLIKESVIFVKTQSKLPDDVEKEQMYIIVDHIIDITDTPFLPDNYTDPFLKALSRPLIDVFIKVVDKNFDIIPNLNEEEFSEQRLENFIKTMHETYADGFQLSDLVVYIEQVFSFVLGFTSLQQQEQKQACVIALNLFIEQVPVPMVPSMIATPVLKSLSHSLVEMVFSQFSN